MALAEKFLKLCERPLFAQGGKAGIFPCAQHGVKPEPLRWSWPDNLIVRAAER